MPMHSRSICGTARHRSDGRLKICKARNGQSSWQSGTSSLRLSGVHRALHGDTLSSSSRLRGRAPAVAARANRLVTEHVASAPHTICDKNRILQHLRDKYVIFWVHHGVLRCVFFSVQKVPQNQVQEKMPRSIQVKEQLFYLDFSCE